MKVTKLNCKLIQKITIAGLLSSLALTSCTPLKTPTIEIPESRSRDGIIGGTEMVAGEELQQSVVAVYDLNEGELCTGTLLPNNLVITAAHCIGEKTEMMYIFFGTNLTDESDRLPIDKIEVSPYWASRQYHDKDVGDLALIHFVGKVPEGYKPAELLSTANKKLLQNGTSVILAGYGLSDAKTNDGAGVLRQTKVVIENTQFGSSEILLNQTDGTGACHGDSGGPAFVEVNGKFYLWGVTSRGIDDKANDCSAYAAYSSTVYYRTWINRMAKKLSSSLVKNEILEKN